MRHYIRSIPSALNNFLKLQRLTQTCTLPSPPQLPAFGSGRHAYCSPVWVLMYPLKTGPGAQEKIPCVHGFWSVIRLSTTLHESSTTTPGSKKELNSSGAEENKYHRHLLASKTFWWVSMMPKLKPGQVADAVATTARPTRATVLRLNIVCWIAQGEFREEQNTRSEPTSWRKLIRLEV